MTSRRVLWAVAFLICANHPLPPIEPGSVEQTAPDGWVDRSPHESGYALVNGVRLHYLDWGGKGEPLLFLAGLFSSAHSFDDLAPDLTDHCRVLALTRRGHGRSDSPATGYRLDILVEDLREFLDFMKIDRVVLAGVSAGGVEAALFATRYPERVARLVYLDSAYDHSERFAQKWALALSRNPVKNTTLPFPPKAAQESFATFRRWHEQDIGPWSSAVEADTREMYLTPDGRVKSFPASLQMAQEVIQSGTVSPVDYSQVRAPALGVFAIPIHPDIPGGASPDLRRKAQAFLDEVLRPMQREQIETVRLSGSAVTIVELLDTTHGRFMSERRDEIARAMKSFLKHKASVGRSKL
jgi:pimeloyl-ACP methyl ester carboxylesterase